MANMYNRQTYAIRDLDLIFSMVALMDAQTIYVVGVVVGCPRFHDPRTFIMVGGRGRVAGPLLVLVDMLAAIALIEALMPQDFSYLALGMDPPPTPVAAPHVAVAAAITIGTAAIAVATVALMAAT